MKFSKSVLALLACTSALAGNCGTKCRDGSSECSTAGDVFVLYKNNYCYIGDISTGRMDQSPSLVGNDFTNENDTTLIKRIKQRKYQVNGWLYCPVAKKSPNYTKVTKVRLENLEGKNNKFIQCRKADNMKGVITAGPFTDNPIAYATVSSGSQFASGIESGKVTLVNEVTYFDKNDEIVYKCEEPVLYNVYFGENSWTSC